MGIPVIPFIQSACPSIHARRGRHPLVNSRSLLLLGMAMFVTATPVIAGNWWSSSPTLSIGAATVNVRTAGALGNGQHDDTAAFQAAINSLPASGGTIVVPAGNYMINALVSINMRSHTRLELAPLAQLIAIPNSSDRSYVIKAWRVSNVEIAGGTIVGERIRHVGDTGEWGMGIDVLGSSLVNLHDLKVADCWGDGVYVGAIGSAGHATVSSDVTINHVVSTDNRRQGLSIGPVQRVYVVNSTFSNSNGTAPQAGIDIEPMTQGLSQNIRVEDSTMTGNFGNGVELHDYVSGLVIKSSTIKDNHGFGVLSVGASQTWIAQDLIDENGLDGVAMTSTTHDVKITGNVLQYNSTRWFVANDKSIYMLTPSPRDIEINSTTSNIFLASNTLSPTP
jgi:hypothetical protein